MFAVTVLLCSLIKWGYGAAAKAPVNDGMPKTLWIAMGLQDNDFRMGGWSNAYNEQTYVKSNRDSKKSSEKAVKNIKERLGFFAENPGKAFEFFGNKLRSTWTEPTFQSLWSGPLKDCEQPVKTGFLKNLYGGGAAYEAVNEFGAVITAMIYVSALTGMIYSLASRGKIVFFGLVICMYLAGGFIFHTVWETKSQCVYPYVYMLIPFAAGWLSRAAHAVNVFFPYKGNCARKKIT